MQSKRSLKVAELLREEVATVIRNEVNDPAIKFVTVTKVMVSPDLKVAKIYLNILGQPDIRKETLAALERAKSFIRFHVGRNSTLRFVPELRFIYDDTLDYVENIQNLIKKINK
jgi:ribosome-binding factor A